jgi:hypothetical protein
MRPGLAKIIENVRISTYYESAETNLHTAENACGIDYADTWTLKKFIDSQQANVQLAVLPVMDVKTLWNAPLELLKRAYRLPELTWE